IHHLADGLAFDGQTRSRRVGDADAGVEQAQIVVDLGDGPHRRTRVFRGGLLLDGDCRAQAVDVIDVRLLHQLQELACIGRQRFHIAPLPLGVDRVKSERGFARAGQAGQNHQLVAGDVDIDILEIVLARAADGDELLHGYANSEGCRLLRFTGQLFTMRDSYIIRSLRERIGVKPWRAASTKSSWSAIWAATPKFVPCSPAKRSASSPSRPRRPGGTRLPASARNVPNGIAW